MSIWCSWPTIGLDEDDTPDPDAPCLTYWEGFSNHYPAVGEEFPAAVGLDSVPAFCMPGATTTDDAGEDVAPWLRLSLMTTTGRGEFDRPAVEALRDQLNEWLALDYREDDDG